MAPLTLHPIDADACLVRRADGQVVGSLKRIGPGWKFKAIGHGPHGELIPGGGPLTHRHNTVFEALDAVAVNARLLGDCLFE